MVLIFSSLIMNNNLFTCLLDFCISSLEKYLFMSFAYFSDCLFISSSSFLFYFWLRFSTFRICHLQIEVVLPFFSSVMPDLQDLSSLIRDWTQAISVNTPNLNHWTTMVFSCFLISNLDAFYFFFLPNFWLEPPVPSSFYVILLRFQNPVRRDSVCFVQIMCPSLNPLALGITGNLDLPRHVQGRSHSTRWKCSTVTKGGQMIAQQPKNKQTAIGSKALFGHSCGKSWIRTQVLWFVGQ